MARYSGFDGRAFAHRRVIIPAISVGRHGLGTIAPGPNGRLYLGAGAEQDALAGGHETSGTVVSFKGDGSDLRIEATGLRGPFGLAFMPGTASLLVTDNGRDDLGVQRPPDELNLVRDVTRAAPDFGFPDCYDQGGRACAGTAAPLALLPAHAGVGGVAVTPRLGRARADRLRGRERLDRAGRRRRARGCGASSCAGARAAATTRAARSSPRASASRTRWGPRSARAGRSTSRCSATGAVVRFFPGYGP